MRACWDLLNQPLVHRLGWTLLHSLWQGALVAVFFAIVHRGMRNRSVNACYLAGCMALVLLLLIPAVTFFSAGQIHSAFAQSQSSHHWTLFALDDSSDTPIGSTDRSPRLLDTMFRANGALAPWLVPGWLLGVVIFSMRLVHGCYTLRHLKRELSGPLDPAWLEILNDLRCRLEVSRPVRLFQSALIEVPTLIGWLRPMILLPVSSVTGLTPSQLEAVLAHELAHVRRCDYLVNAFQILIETLLFYHPAAWWISHRVREDREQCCDDLVVEICGDRVAYATALATLEEWRAGSSSLAFAASGQPLLGRIRRLVGAAQDRAPTAREISGLALLVLGLVFILGGLSLLLTSPSYQAVARIKIEPYRDGQFSSNEGKADPFWFQTEFGVIQSESVLNQVAKDLGLSREWGKKYGRSGSLNASETLAMLRGRLSLRPVRNTSLIEIRVFSDRPSEAAQIANAVSDTYKMNRSNQRQAQIEGGIRLLEDRWEEQERKIRQAQLELDHLSRELQIPGAVANEATLASAMTHLNGEAFPKIESVQIETKADLARQETLLNELKRLSAEELARVLPTSSPDPLLNALLEQLSSAEEALLIAQHDYGPEHGEFIKTSGRVEDLRDKVRKRIAGILVAMESRIAASRNYLAVLEDQIHVALTNDLALTEKFRPYFEKKNDLEELRRFRQVLNMKIAAEKVDADLPRSSIVEIIDRAEIPLQPIAANRQRGISFALIGLILIVIGLIMVRGANHSAAIAQAV